MQKVYRVQLSSEERERLGLEQALERHPQQNRRQLTLDGKSETKLIACGCGPPPEGRSKWTLKLLAKSAWTGH